MLFTHFKYLNITLRCVSLKSNTLGLKCVSLNSNTLESLLLAMEACTRLLKRWQTISGLPLPEFTELVIARISSTENMQCYGFSRSLL